MRLGKSFTSLGINFFLISKNRNRSSYQAHLIGQKGITEAEALQRCLAVRGLDPRGATLQVMNGDDVTSH